MGRVKNKPVRIKDIANKAGVSVGTVDRVIHGRGKVSKKKEEKVRHAMEQLQYEPNLFARSLAMQARFKIAVVIPKYAKDSFWLSQLEGIESGLRYIKDFGFSLEVFDYDDQKPGDLIKQKKKFLAGSFDALLLAPTMRDDAIAFLKTTEKNNIPYVLINTNLDREGKLFLSYVGQNSYQSGSLAAKLLSLNVYKSHDEFLVLHMEKAVDNREHMIQKELGFRSYFEEIEGFDGRIYTENIPQFSKKEAFKRKIRKLIKEHQNLSGIFVTTSRIHYLSSVLLDLERDDITIVGFDLIKQNIKQLYEYNRMFLINQNPYLQGYYGMIHIFEHLLKKKEVRKKLYLPLDVVTLENYRYYLHLNEHRLS